MAVEMLNGAPLGSNRFRIDNAPFFVENISYHDIISALPGEVPGQYDFESVWEQSSFSSLSVIILDPSMDTFLMDLLRGLQCVVEYGEFGAWRILAVAFLNRPITLARAIGPTGGEDAHQLRGTRVGRQREVSVPERRSQPNSR